MNQSLMTHRQLFDLAQVLEGMPLLAVMENSPAEKAGLRYGDIVLFVNDMRVNNADSFVKARSKNPNTINLVIWRNSSELTFSFKFEGNIQNNYN